MKLNRKKRVAIALASLICCNSFAFVFSIQTVELMLLQAESGQSPVLNLYGGTQWTGSLVADAAITADQQAGDVFDLSTRDEPGATGPALAWTDSGVSAALDGQQSFTLTFWVNGAGETKVPWRSCTWLNLGSQRVWLDAYPDGRLRVKVNGQFVGLVTEAIRLPTNGWFFVAVTYDANASESETGCQVYMWSPEEDLTGTGNLKELVMDSRFVGVRAGALSANGPMVIGANTILGENGADGLLAEMRWYGSHSDSYGALSYQKLRWVMQASAPAGVLDASAPGPDPGGEWLFFADSMDKVLPSVTNWSARSAATNVDLLMAKDESESFQLVAVAGAQSMNASLTVSPLFLDTEELSVNVYSVGYAQCGPSMRNYPTEASGLWPDPLLPFSSAQIPAGETRCWWFTVDTDADTVSGVYTGSVTVVSDRGSRVVPLTVEVLPVTLPRPGRFGCQIGLYWSQISAWYRGTSEYVGELPPSMLEDWARFLMRYRITPKNLGYEYREVYIGTERLPSLGDNLGRLLYHREDADQVDVDLSEIAQVINALGPWPDDTLSSYRLPPYNEFSVSPVPSDPVARVLAPVNAFLNEWSTNNLPAAYLYGIDEPRVDQTSMVRDIYAAIKQQSPQTKIMQVLSYGNPGDLEDLVDIWCPITSMLHSESDFFNGQMDSGKKLWAYVASWPAFPYGNFFIDRPGIESRLLPLQVSKEGASSLLYWLSCYWSPQVSGTAAQHFPEIPFSFNYNSVSGDGMLIYPGTNETPWASMRLEQLRDGIEDAEALLLLQDRLAWARSIGIAESELEEISSWAVLPDNISRNLLEGTENRDVLLDFRRNLLLSIKEIEELIQTYQNQSVAWESFDYDVGSISGQNGGHGFSGAWENPTGELVTQGSLILSNSAFSVGNKLELSSATVSRTVNWINISLAVNATNYISMLVNKGGTITGDSNEDLTFWIKPATGTIAGFQIMSDERVRLNDRAGSVVGTETLDLNTTYLMLLKIVTNTAGNDEVYLTWFKEGDIIPSDEGSIVWKLSHSFDNSYGGVASSVEFSVGSAITASVDEIRVRDLYRPEF